MSKIETTGAVATCNLWDDRFVSQLWLESESEDPLMIKAAFGDTREESARKLSDFVESADSEFDDYDEGTHATAFIACLKNLKKQEGR